MSVVVQHVVSALLVNAEGRLLLQQRDDRPGLAYAGWWTLFGGAVEDGETPDDAIKRELWEELRLAVGLSRWKTIACPVRSTHECLTYNHVYYGWLARPVDSLTLYEGQGMALFGKRELDAMALAYAQETIAREFIDNLDRIRQEAHEGL